MRTGIRGGLIAAAVVLTVGRIGAESPATPGPDRPRPAARSGVLVELFTSQGCSSCPPADRLLSRLGGEAGVVPLAFHVDYWNHDGWSDPFSRHAWSARQQAYVRRFRLDAEFTPQAVVDGAAQLVGSRESDLRAAIASASSRPAAAITLRADRSGDRVLAGIRVERSAAAAGRRLDLMVALFETGLVTTVGSGENGGHVLHDDYVVRTLERAAKIAPGDPDGAELVFPLRIARRADPARLGVAAFLQDPKTLEVFGAAAVPVSDAGPMPGAK